MSWLNGYFGTTTINITGGAIGGGAAGAPQSGAITLPATNGTVAVDLTSVDANIALPSGGADGLAFQFDSRGTKGLIFTAATIIDPSTGVASPNGRVQVNPYGQSVTAKYNAAWSEWNLV